MARRNWRPIAVFLFFFNGSLVCAQDVRIGVLGIFHPQNLTLTAAAGESLVVSNSEKAIFLTSGSNSGTAHIGAYGELVVLDFGGKKIQSKEIRVASSNGGVSNFVLGIRGKIERQYHGTLDIKVVNRELVPIITMDLETAVSSIVQAESAGDSPVEELKAQAIVTRSYLVAGKGRHTDFDFCDLTHCQYLREPPKRESPAAVATVSTRGLILSFEGKPLVAMFTRSCGGQTRTPTELGMPNNGYPYFPVRCDACYKNPVGWRRQVSEQDAGILFAQGEAGRLAVDRRLGWSAVPSNNFTARKKDGEVVLQGAGEGHGVGLCQRGARAMAAEGVDFRKIILHYFPNTTITSLPGQLSPQSAF